MKRFAGMLALALATAAFADVAHANEDQTDVVQLSEGRCR
jgi:hypothetical protein